ncbi:MAG: hypothetical protein CMO55_21360 [Verrucomicrobiales bacterium]|nr:hypothetical protein [Verrucomicrobiales bacterium]
MVTFSRLAVVVCVLVLSVSSAVAQFHSKKENGQTAVNSQAISTAQKQAAALSAVQGKSRLGKNANSTIYVSEAHQKNYGATIGQQRDLMIETWARSIHHSDGSYTESKHDFEQNFLEQITKSKNGVVLQKRMITLDERGYPYEVMIYDGRDTFKYRGVLAYDGSGRFKEEQLYDPKGTLIRRKIQEYTQQGQRLPLKSVDYVANVPEDLKLVITREEEQTGSNPEDKPQKTGLFSKKPEQAQGSAQPQQAASSAPKMKGLKLGRMFGGKKKDK